MASTPPNGTAVIAYNNAFTPTQMARTLLVIETKGFWFGGQKEPLPDLGPHPVFSREGKSQHAAPEVPCFPETSPKGREPERAYSLLLDAFASTVLECF